MNKSLQLAVDTLLYPNTGSSLFDVPDSQPWQKLKDEVRRDVPSTDLAVLIDGTTIRNAHLLMRDGLGAPDTMRGALLPDLAVLATALAYFDKILILDSGLNDVERRELRSWYPEIVVMPAAWREIRTLHQNDLFVLFKAVQNAFVDQSYAEEWGQVWKTLLNRPTMPVSFRPFIANEANELLDSPAHPLHPDFSSTEGNCLDAINGKVGVFNVPFPCSPEEEVSVLASYHALRSIFYYAIGDWLGVPYLPSGMRGIASSWVPHALLSTGHQLHPDRLAEFELYQVLSSNIAGRWLMGRSQRPILRPMLAVLLGRMMEYGSLSKTDWKSLIIGLRDEVKLETPVVRDLIRQCRVDKPDVKRMNELFERLGPTQETGGLGGIGLDLAMGLLKMKVTGDPMPVLSATGKAAARSPWRIAVQTLRSFKVRYYSRACDLAQTALDAQGLCQAVWKRGLTSGELSYLEAVQHLHAAAGQAPWV